MIDAHVHMWDPAVSPVPWLTGDLRPLSRRFGLAELRTTLAAASVDRAIVVQAEATTTETAHLLRVASQTHRIAGVVGWFDLVADDLGSWLRTLSDHKLVGIRGRIDLPGAGRAPERAVLRRNLDTLVAEGLVLELLTGPEEARALPSVALSMPELHIVIDHLGQPRSLESDRRDWLEWLAAVSAAKNVWLKLSGLATLGTLPAQPAVSATTLVATALERFGTRRMLFGSDWPISLLGEPYPDTLRVVRQMLDTVDENAMRAILGGNAREAYRLG